MLLINHQLLRDTQTSLPELDAVKSTKRLPL
jgi:hypothetical protein